MKKNTRKRRNGSSDVVTNVLWGGDSSDGKNELEKDFNSKKKKNKKKKY